MLTVESWSRGYIKTYQTSQQRTCNTSLQKILNDAIKEERDK